MSKLKTVTEILEFLILSCSFTFCVLSFELLLFCNLTIIILKLVQGVNLDFQKENFLVLFLDDFYNCFCNNFR